MLENKSILAVLLDDLERFVERFVVYPSEASRVAHVLWIAHTHLMEHWESTPRLAFLGPYPRILDTGCDYAAVGSVAARRAS